MIKEHGTCKNVDLAFDVEPCRSCIQNAKWEPKEAEVVKECDTCKKGSKSTGYLCDIGLDKCDQSYGSWVPIETNINETILEKESNMKNEQSYGVQILSRNEKGVIIDQLAKGLVFMNGVSEQAIRDRVNREKHVDIDRLEEAGDVEYIIRPFLSS